MGQSDRDSNPREQWWGAGPHHLSRRLNQPPPPSGLGQFWCFCSVRLCVQWGLGVPRRAVRASRGALCVSVCWNAKAAQGK